ncbi:MAG: hypothetical protein LQ351_004425 [Letrouitia transgressa]|nr:MAG: hypothetical protein LQ351_004425 [Letrouitia transgressa]
MLLRAAVGPARFRGASPIVRVAATTLSLRAYAKPSKPRKPLEYSSRHGPNALRSHDTNNGSAGKPFKDSAFGSSVRPGEANLPKPPDDAGQSISNSSKKISQPPSSSDIDNAQVEEEAHDQSPRQPIPDLTQGIPPTLEAELAQAERASQVESKSLNITEEPADTASTSSRRTSDLPKSANITSLDRRRNKLANYMYLALFGITAIGTIYLGRNWENEEEERKHPDAPSGWGFGLFYNRASARLADVTDYYNEPAFPKLLPNTDPAWERPYTLVLSLEDLLIHSEWTREHGWRMAKRPGVDYFLRYLSQYYELVIFTSVPSMMGDPIIRKLDPYRIIMWPLFREATRYKNGEYIKDLSYLNRPLNKVILLDTVPSHGKLQPENSVILKKWTGDPQDNELVSMIPFFEYIAAMGFPDTREVIKSFDGTHIPSEFSNREQIARKKFQKQYAEEVAKRPKRKKSSGGGMLGSLGIGSGRMVPGGMMMMEGEESLGEAYEKGKTYMDQVRERGQRQYEIIEKEIRENGDKWVKEMAEEEKKMQEEAMKGMKNSFLGGLLGSGGSSAGK